jgi:class 3 adenylate cyclase/tetratricopeptide (TPR) repeat protein
MAVCASCGREAVAEFRFCPECGAPAERALSDGVRKTVSVVFCDLVGSTALGESTDPEALRGLLGRYFARMRSIVELHGGTVEKFIGDAVVAVFGVPVVHEDDALRACRAAVEIRDALPELGLGGRLGVNTGEVMTGKDDLLAAGDTMNVAARLEQAAPSGGILIGEPTYALVRDVVEAETVEPLALKGKSERVGAYRLVSVLPVPERSHELPFVGRQDQLERIVAAWERASSQGRCELVTVVGDAGVGKSRLVAEALTRVGGRVVRGRCLPYGEGITYWPLVEVLKQLAMLPTDPAAAAAINSLLGTSDVASNGDEIAWAFRKLLAEQAPLVVVFDDLQWGEETFLDLIESTALLSSGAPLLLVCMARPELLQRRPGWAGVVPLEPLGREQTDALIGEQVAPDLRERIADAAGGNPLFISEMLAMVAEQDVVEVEVPPTLKALLAMRLDQLDEAERKVLERGSIEGEIFHRGSVQALAPAEERVDARLAALVRHQLVRPDRAQLPGDDGYRFRHLLIRDTAYESLPKTTRAELHRRFADWLAVHGSSLVELDEVLGYHLEQAASYLAELGRPDATLAEQASIRLIAAAERARWRWDRNAARSFYGRALKLLPQPDIHVEIAYALDQENPRDALPLLEDIVTRADARSDAAGAALARTVGAYAALWAREGSVDELERRALAAILPLEAENDHAGLAEVWFALANGVYNHRRQFDEMVRAASHAREYETLAGIPHRSDRVHAMGLSDGSIPVVEALRRLETLDPAVFIDLERAVLLAMNDELESARALADAADQHAQELGHSGDYWRGEIERIAGNHEAAAARIGAWCELMAATGETAGLGYHAALRARELCFLGRYDEAESLALWARDRDEDEPTWRQVIALIKSNRGEHDQAELLAREALSLLRKTEYPQGEGDALCDLAYVLEAAGRPRDAVAAWHEALGAYERKGIVPLTRRVQDRLAALADAAT